MEESTVTTADGYPHKSWAYGRVGPIKNIKLTPTFTQNLLSVSQLNDMGYEVTFSPFHSFITIANPNIHNKAHFMKVDIIRKDSLFYIPVEILQTLPPIDSCNVASTNPADSLVTWHQRTHLSDELLLKLAKRHAKGITIQDDYLTNHLSICEDCGLTKAERNNRKRKKNRIIPEHNLEQIDTDVKVVNSPGFRNEIYILSFRCARSKYTWLYHMRNKSDAKACLQRFKIDVINQLNQDKRLQSELILRRIHSDGGGEYIGEFSSYCTELGIKHTLAPPYCPELNSYAESYWRILMQTTRAFLSHAKLQTRLWTYACTYANYILNRTLLRPIGGELKTSFEWLYNDLPDLSNIRTWGTPVYSLIPEQLRSNKSLGNRAFLGYFVGISNNYVHSVEVYDSQGSVSPHKIENVLFDEVIRPRFHVDTGEEIPDLPVIIDQDSECPEEPEESQSHKKRTPDDKLLDKRKRSDFVHPQEEVRRSKRLKGKRVETYQGKASRTFATLNLSNARMNLSEEEIRIIERAEDKPLTPENTLKWLEAIQKEKSSMLMNDVFELVARPTKRKVLRTMWRLTNKKDELGNIIAKKARNVLLGNLTQEGIDYYETYSPVGKLSSLRLFLAIVVQLKMYMFQGDFNTAFLNASIEEDIFLEIPHFFKLDDFTQPLPQDDPLKHMNPSQLCLKLKKSQYGLKQSSRNWYITLNEFLINQLGFEPCNSEPCLYTFRNERCRAIMFLYVDDFILASTSSEFIDECITTISSKYQIKKIGDPKTILGISIRRKNDTIYLNQNGKIEDLAKLFHLEKAAPVTTPLDPDHKLTKHMSSRKDKESIYHPDHPNSKADQLVTTYRSIVGKLNHISQATRPDIAYAVAVLSKYLNNPMISHLYAALRVVKYLYSTRQLCIRFQRDSHQQLELEAYSDSDWAGDVDTRRSQSGTILLLAGGPIHWMSACQHLVSLSSAEAEVIALKQTVKETLWMRNILQETYLEQKKPIPVYEDNSSTIKIVTNPMISKKNRHMEIGYYFIASHIEIGSISLNKIEGQRNYADLMTKYLRLSHHQHFLKDLLHTYYED